MDKRCRKKSLVGCVVDFAGLMPKPPQAKGECEGGHPTHIWHNEPRKDCATCGKPLPEKEPRKECEHQWSEEGLTRDLCLVCGEWKENQIKETPKRIEPLGDDLGIAWIATLKDKINELCKDRNDRVGL